MSVEQLYTDSIAQECENMRKEVPAKQISVPPIVERQIKEYPQFRDELAQMFSEANRETAALDRYVFKNAMFVLGDVRRCSLGFLRQLPRERTGRLGEHREQYEFTKQKIMQLTDENSFAKTHRLLYLLRNAYDAFSGSVFSGEFPAQFQSILD